MPTRITLLTRPLRISFVVLFCAPTIVCACGDDSSPASSSSPRGGAGESCAARRDCADELLCIGQICVEASTGPSTRGTLGESCQAHNDCADGLACVALVCVSEKGNVTPGAKSCYKVECASKDDCCKDFTPSLGCTKFQEDCAADPAYCLTYHTFCECNRACDAELCVDTPPACTQNAECTSFLAPFCVNGACRECAQHGDCANETDQCIAGVCQAPCSQNEHCPLLHACQNGECVEVGCTTDKECFFLLKDSRAKCAAQECLVPCLYSTECGELEVCHDGACVFVGCDSDEECRAYFGLERRAGDVKAVCK